MNFSIVTEIAGIISSISLAVIAVILIINAFEKFQFNKKVKAYYDLENRYKELVKRDEEEMMRILFVREKCTEHFCFFTK